MSNPPLRAVLAGCGSICGSWLPHIIAHPDLELVALLDLHPKAARKRAEQFGIPEVAIETDLAAALSHHAPVDIVIDLTIPAAHHAITLTALRHGCHVLGEKPLSDSIEQAREMVAEAARTGRIYAVSQNRRYKLGVRRLRAFLDSGALGRVTTACCDFFMALPAGGFRAVMDHVLLVDMSIHHFDIARFLLGGAAARTVLCHEWNPPNSQFAHGAAAVATFEMEGSATFVYNGSWAAEGFVSSWQGAWRIIGEHGTVYWDGETGFQARAVLPGERNKRTEGQPVEVPALDFPEQSEGQESILAEFVRAVRGGTAPETICTDNIKSLAMVFGAVESAGRGARVELSA